MYIDTSVVLDIAAIVAALSTIISIIIAVYKFTDRDKRQTIVIKGMQDELTVIVYGLRGALQGLIEQGCDGPCKDALKELDKHINKQAHTPGM